MDVEGRGRAKFGEPRSNVNSHVRLIPRVVTRHLPFRPCGSVINNTDSNARAIHLS